MLSECIYSSLNTMVSSSFSFSVPTNLVEKHKINSSGWMVPLELRHTVILMLWADVVWNWWGETIVGWSSVSHSGQNFWGWDESSIWWNEERIFGKHAGWLVRARMWQNVALELPKRIKRFLFFMNLISRVWSMEKMREKGRFSMIIIISQFQAERVWFRHLWSPKKSFSFSTENCLQHYFIYCVYLRAPVGQLSNHPVL